MRIFIQIASYRDKELFPTIRQAIGQAAHPERLSFGICCQDELTVEEEEFLKRVPRCRVIYIAPADSKGCCYARSLTQTLWQGEEYTLQIDSHTRFVKNWDVKAFELLQRCPSEKPLLTCYAPDYEDEENLSASAYSLGACSFSFYGVLLANCKLKVPPYHHPVRGAFFSAHFLFASSRWIEEVPYDPNLYFHGEEITLAVRSWTKGWDIFYPDTPIVFHQYQQIRKDENEKGKGRVCHWDEHEKTWEMFDLLSQRRCRMLLGMEQDSCDFGPYGLGEVRTLADYELFSGVDFAKKRLTSKAFCGLYETEAPPLENMPKRVRTDAQRKVVGITAFKEMNRDHWDYTDCSVDDYLYWFRNLAGVRNLDLRCYCEPEMQEKLKPFFTHTYDLDSTNSFLAKYDEREREIMLSKEFRTLINERRGNLQRSQWGRSMMTHSKISCLQQAARQFEGYTHYAWIDFGGLRFPVDSRVEVDWSFLTDDRIHLQSFTEDLSCFNLDPKTMCLKSPKLIAAALIVVPVSAIDWLAEVYEEEIQLYQSLNITDDEQNLLAQLVNKYPERFKLERVNSWYDLLENLFVQPQTLE